MSNQPDIISTSHVESPWYQNLDVKQLVDTANHQGNMSIAAILNTSLDKRLAIQQSPICNRQNFPIQFVAQDCLPNDEAYESFIAKTGQIPTRDNYHDLLNGLIWLNFPKAKAVFNQLHAHDIARQVTYTSRTPLRNALTLFDENGGVVVSSNATILQDLQNFAWSAAFVARRQQWLGNSRCAAFFPFGHALLEKLIRPRKNITSHTLLILVNEDWFAQSIELQRAQLDIKVAAIFQQVMDDGATDALLTISSKNFQPIPVMGIPGFCEQNEQADFYQDPSVFRLPRAIKAPIFTMCV